MSADKLHFLTRKIQDHQRSASRPLQCPFCGEGIQIVGEPKFLEHAKSLHPNIAAEYPEGTAWKEAIREAVTNA